MKLAVIRPFEALSLPGIRATGTVTIEPGKGSFAEWIAHVRGPSVFLVSPPGFMQDDGTPRRRVYEFPRNHCNLGWDIDQGDQPPVNWSPPCVTCEQPVGLSDGSTCRACDEKKHGVAPAGTPPYMAPEQPVGDRDAKPDNMPEPAGAPEKGPKKR